MYRYRYIYIHTHACIADVSILTLMTFILPISFADHSHSGRSNNVPSSPTIQLKPYTSHLSLIRPKKINHKFLRPIFSRINEAGRLYFLLFIASDQNEGFYFFSCLGVMRHFLLQ